MCSFHSLFASSNPREGEETMQKVNNLSKKIGVLNKLQEWTSLVFNFSKRDVKVALQINSEYEIT